LLKDYVFVILEDMVEICTFKDLAFATKKWTAPAPCAASYLPTHAVSEVDGDISAVFRQVGGPKMRHL
jgi:hypothetical protein